MNTHKFTNNLISETSPYLLQHAHNPVNWQAWNATALDSAKKENKLLLISIGYSSCHWCHVMEHECFEDEDVAAVMNQHFISIKVDREERPDIDQVYMNAIQLMTGSGGWPLNCVALPDGRPIWGATYVSKENWIQALGQLSKMYKEKPNQVIDYAVKLTEGIKNTDLISLNSNREEFSVSELETVIDEWKQHMDFDLGGRRGAPKFPMPNNYSFLLRYAIQANNSEILTYVNTSLTNMAYGGVYDQIGGGFSRYSVDKKWHVPHFEKMLYDNGQLVSLYAEAYQATKNKLYKSVVYETLQFVEDELTNNEGAFYSSLDADSVNSKGKLEEGAFYVWTKQELEAILKNDFQLFSEYYNVNYYGFWEHDNYVLIRKNDDVEIAKKNSISVLELESKVKIWKKVLLKERAKKERPRLDDKSLTSWNALMLKGYIDAYKVFNEPHFLEVAIKNATFIYTKQLQEDGSLNHSYKNGSSTINGFLEDYATVIDAYISLYEATSGELWLNTAKQLVDYCLDHFFDEKRKMFYFTSNKDNELITRKMEIEDNVMPASNSIMANNLFKLSYYFSNSYFLDISKQMLQNIAHKIYNYGSGYSNWLQLMCNFSGNFYQIAVLGKASEHIVSEINKHYIPNKLIGGSSKLSTIPLMKNRFVETKNLIYVCVDGTCQLPIENVEEALNKLKINF
ncbi:thioredoxin domain-containing protein [Lutibacter sp. A80]|uniref:thioredoxin domain-containing protein n=1 Tax=Lutibacter sp. A80 TaxID=2918453 RepID=UPI001F05C1D5|nr:thioredoxin domain-containing protein [Lutibacter sp. A80]UMB59246.1 thioredoxin domain-containing protein [Lutibacter sp. A80]